jgi:hypothetical protein
VVVNIETTPGGRVNQDTSSSAVLIKEMLQQNIAIGRNKTGKLCDRSRKERMEEGQSRYTRNLQSKKTGEQSDRRGQERREVSQIRDNRDMWSRKLR